MTFPILRSTSPAIGTTVTFSGSCAPAGGGRVLILGIPSGPSTVPLMTSPAPTEVAQWCMWTGAALVVAWIPFAS